MSNEPTTNDDETEDSIVSGENVLDIANETVGDRAKQYGPPTENFAVIANLWSAYLGVEITPYDYATMMELAKIGRGKTGSTKEDNRVDRAGYALTADLVAKDGSEPAPHHGSE